MDHVNVKIFATPGSQVNWHELIPVFHRWIRENVLPGTLIDVTDYSHVPHGPGILLIADDAIYSVDEREGQLGFLYNRRRTDQGSDEDKIRRALDAAIDAAKKLEKEVNGLTFDERRFEVFINDRALAPATEETEREIRPIVEAIYAERFGQPALVQRDTADTRGLFRLLVQPS